MARIDQLLTNFCRHVALPPRTNLPFSQRVWFLVYPPEDERRMKNRIGEFELATREADLDWHQVDLTGSFADWIDTYDSEEREACLADPEVVEDYADPGFCDFLCRRIMDAMAAISPEQAERTILAVTGLMELYDFVHVSYVVDALNTQYPGAILLFFPGERVENTYRFINARTGWNYLAVPILAES